MNKYEPLPESKDVFDLLQGFQWHIDNKYYTAEVLLCCPKEAGNPPVLPSLEAIVTVVDDKKSSFSQAKEYWKRLEDLEPEVRIILCHGFTKFGDVKRKDIIEWCIDNSFELVELNKSEEDDDDDEDENDEFKEVYGCDRIVQALHAHSWPNLELKERDERALAKQLQEKLGLCDGKPANQEPHSPVEDGYQLLPDHEETKGATSNQTMRGERDSQNEQLDERLGAEANGESSSQSTSGKVKGENKKKAVGPDNVDAMLNDDLELFRALGNEDPGTESFDELFSKMTAMKEKASSLSAEERKNFAEKVVVAFWQAVGGDADEIAGISDED